MQRSPDVTVVIPTRDRWDLLSSSALPSALLQEDVNLEVVVVDDGSRDGTADKVSAIGDRRVRAIRLDEGRGVARARNAGIQEGVGRWIAFLDDDDLWSPQKLRLQLDAAHGVDAAFAYGGAAAVAEDGTWLYSLEPTNPLALPRTLLSRNVLWGGSSNVVVRADVLRRLGGFDERLFQLCDWDLWIRLALDGAGVACPETIVGCVVHERSMLLVSDDDVFEELDYMERKHADVCAVYGVRLDRRLFTRWVAQGHARAGRRSASVRTFLRGVVRERDISSLARAAATLGSRESTRWGSSRGLRPPLSATTTPSDEPAWLALYRGGRDRTIAEAMSNASSPSER